MKCVRPMGPIIDSTATSPQHRQELVQMLELLDQKAGAATGHMKEFYIKNIDDFSKLYLLGNSASGASSTTPRTPRTTLAPTWPRTPISPLTRSSAANAQHAAPAPPTNNLKKFCRNIHGFSRQRFLGTPRPIAPTPSTPRPSDFASGPTPTQIANVNSPTRTTSTVATSADLSERHQRDDLFRDQGRRNAQARTHPDPFRPTLLATPITKSGEFFEDQLPTPAEQSGGRHSLLRSLWDGTMQRHSRLSGTTRSEARSTIAGRTSLTPPSKAFGQKASGDPADPGCVELLSDIDTSGKSCHASVQHRRFRSDSSEQVCHSTASTSARDSEHAALHTPETVVVTPLVDGSELETPAIACVLAPGSVLVKNPFRRLGASSERLSSAQSGTLGSIPTSIGSRVVNMVPASLASGDGTPGDVFTNGMHDNSSVVDSQPRPISDGLPIDRQSQGVATGSDVMGSAHLTTEELRLRYLGQFHGNAVSSSSVASSPVQGPQLDGPSTASRQAPSLPPLASTEGDVCNEAMGVVATPPRGDADDVARGATDEASQRSRHAQGQPAEGIGNAEGVIVELEDTGVARPYLTTSLVNPVNPVTVIESSVSSTGTSRSVLEQAKDELEDNSRHLALVRKLLDDLEEEDVSYGRAVSQRQVDRRPSRFQVFSRRVTPVIATVGRSLDHVGQWVSNFRGVDQLVRGITYAKEGMKSVMDSCCRRKRQAAEFSAPESVDLELCDVRPTSKRRRTASRSSNVSSASLRSEGVTTGADRQWGGRHKRSEPRDPDGPPEESFCTFSAARVKKGLDILATRGGLHHWGIEGLTLEGLELAVQKVNIALSRHRELIPLSPGAFSHDAAVIRLCLEEIASRSGAFKASDPFRFEVAISDGQVAEFCPALQFLFGSLPPVIQGRRAIFPFVCNERWLAMLLDVDLQSQVATIYVSNQRLDTKMDFDPIAMETVSLHLAQKVLNYFNVFVKDIRCRGASQNAELEDAGISLLWLAEQLARNQEITDLPVGAQDAYRFLLLYSYILPVFQQ